MDQVSAKQDEPAGAAKAGRAPRHERHNLGWYAVFAVIVVVAFAVIYWFTGLDALGIAARFLWNAVVVAVNAALSLVTSLIGVVARSLGLRQLVRVSSVVGGVELGYALSTVAGDAGVRRAHGWRNKLRAGVARLRNGWKRLPLVAKLVIVAALIASQIYLHSLLIIFPVAFVVPVVRQVWARTANFVLGSWYRRRFGRQHRRIAQRIGRLPAVRGAVGAARVTRIRYLCAWRLWRHDPKYRKPSGARRISLLEPLRLLRSGALDAYVGRPLLSGRPAGAQQAQCSDDESVQAVADRSVVRRR